MKLTHKNFIWGLLFVAASYSIIKLLDNYSVFFEALGQLYVAVSPFLLGFVLAYLMNPLMKLVERGLNTSRVVSTLITVGIILLSGYVVGTFTFPYLVENATEFMKQVPNYLLKI